ncbi:MATE family efflux transporter [Nocardia sp. CDC159]|uniref:Probable multidrug resistance protein NorM n=1 Tax=Nocardia pulmonis TaxID=2951408 RepID=A0A9X2EDI4_9NOCA|nr:MULTISPECIES: MATE family efflux transporter [Nocardia]MCM6777168.1 MATE family efflux transporter [Nocardia pulmonis]MCM6790053.1 MATE family efflux transporter [Nocardia sp. CDC159]
MTQLAQVAVSTTNIALMGSLGISQVAAGGLALTLFNQIRTMCVGLITATGNQVATVLSRAEKRKTNPANEIRDVVRASFLIATVAGLLGGLVLIGLGWALQWLGQDASVLAEARPMMVALAPGLLPCLWFQVLRQYSVGMQRPQALLMVTLGSVALNLVLALALMHGWAGLPALGLTGIGIATSLVFLITFAVLWAMVRHDAEIGATLPIRMWPVRWRTIAAELRLGTPIALTYGSEAGMFSVLALVMGTFGPAALAAHNVVYQLVYIVFQVAVGLSHGSSILVSKAVAREEFRHAQGLAWLALRHAAVVAALVGVAYLAVPDLVLRLGYIAGKDDDTVRLAHTLLLIAIVLQFFDAAQNIGNGLLRGVKDTQAGFRLSLVGYWVVGLPTALLLAFPLGLGAAGVWWGLTAGLAATAGLMLRRYFALLAQRQQAERRVLADSLPGAS